MKIRSVLISAVLLSGCGTSIPVNIDVTTANDLPKDIAIKYLNEISGEMRSTLKHDSQKRMSCHFDQHGVNNTISKISYKQAHMDAKIWGTSIDEAYTFSLKVKPVNEGEFSYCFLSQGFDKQKELSGELADKFSKIATALKSLGVKIEQDK